MNEKNINEESNICPFKLQWAIGASTDVGVVNLTTKKRHLIAYACSHIIILYDYVSKDMTSLRGHRNAVRTLSASRDGKWLLSADYDLDSACIVWDTETQIPICSLFNPHGKTSLTAAKLSPDARYLVTVGNEEFQIIKLWFWTDGKDIPDATAQLQETLPERVKRISFGDDLPDEFILTLGHSVTFVSWKHSDTLELHRPLVPKKTQRVMGIFNDSSYISESRRAITITSNGFAIVWGGTNHEPKKSEDEFRNSGKKRYVKSVPLRKENLTRVENHSSIIVIGSSSGQLYFYDHGLKLLYWCDYCCLESAIVSISFDRETNLVKPKIPPSESTLSQSDTTEEDVDDSDEDDDEEVFDSSTPDEKKSDEEKNDSNRENLKEIPLKSVGNERSKIGKLRGDIISRISIEAGSSTTNVEGKFGKLVTCTLESSVLILPNFFILSGSGKIARLDLTKLKCNYVSHSMEGSVTAIAARPESEYVVIGNILGFLSLFKYTTKTCMVTKKTPAIGTLTKLVHLGDGNLDLSHVSCPQTHESLVGVSALRFSPAKDGILVCGLKSGIIWILHPDTLEPIDNNPYKHSSSSIIDLVFTNDGEYLAYSDDAFTVGVFKKKDYSSPTSENNPWIFLGKYHSHCSPIREIVFFKATDGRNTPRLISLGEDRNLVEYDLENSGPYPEPGLKILRIDEIERGSIPRCMAVYPDFGVERFLLMGNCQYKFRLINVETKTIRSTILEPTLSDPIQRIHVVDKTQPGRKKRGYLIFATSKEIGLTILPLDGNPYGSMAMTGHPRKIESTAVSGCGKYVFTIGENDRHVLMWKINYGLLDRVKRSGGDGLTPFYALLEGGKDGWLDNEMRDLFYYAQILQQGENTTATRIVGEKVSILQLPNLTRALGFYPTNNELETMMEEVSYEHYAETGQLTEEISFQRFFRLYINHRPALGLTRDQVRDAFRVFAGNMYSENPNLTSKRFLDILYGRGTKYSDRNYQLKKLHGEPLSVQEAHTYLRRLVPRDEDSTSYTSSRDDEDSTTELNFEFLPPNISYESFIEDILGIENP